MYNYEYINKYRKWKEAFSYNYPQRCVLGVKELLCSFKLCKSMQTKSHQKASFPCVKCKYDVLPDVWCSLSICCEHVSLITGSRNPGSFPGRAVFRAIFSTNLMIEGPWMLIWITRIMQNWKWKLQNWCLGTFSVNKSALASPVELPDQTKSFKKTKNKTKPKTSPPSSKQQLQASISIPALLLNERLTFMLQGHCGRTSQHPRTLHVHNQRVANLLQTNEDMGQLKSKCCRCDLWPQEGARAPRSGLRWPLF